MNRYYSEFPERKATAGTPSSLRKAGTSPSVVMKSAQWPGLPGPGQLRDRSMGVKEVYAYPVHAGLSSSKPKTEKWIQGAIKHPGALTKKAKKAGESPMEFAKEHMHAPGTTGKQARLAMTLRKMHK